MRTTIAALLGVLAIGLAGCSGGTEPSPPPSASEPLTTSSPTNDAAPTTESPPPATESPTEASSTDLPPEAMEDTEAGAEAFALHYIDLINQTGMEPEMGVLEPLGSDGCRTCANFEGNVEYLANNGLRNDGPAAEVHDSTAVDLGATTNVEVRFDQLAIDVLDDEGQVARSYELIKNARFVFRMAYNDGWTIDEIQVG